MFLERSVLLVALGSLLQLACAGDACAEGTCKSSSAGTDLDTDLQQDILLLQQQKELQAHEIQHHQEKDLGMPQLEELILKQAKRQKRHGLLMQVKSSNSVLKVKQNLNLSIPFPTDFDPDECDDVLQDLIAQIAKQASGSSGSSSDVGMDGEKQLFCTKYALQYMDQSVVPPECIIESGSPGSGIKYDPACCMYELRCSSDNELDACNYDRYGAWPNSMNPFAEMVYGKETVTCVGSQEFSPVPMGICKCKTASYCNPTQKYPCGNPKR
jgi:hypothetical protein